MLVILDEVMCGMAAPGRCSVQAEDIAPTS
jgi:hypothetical protein